MAFSKVQQATAVGSSATGTSATTGGLPAAPTPGNLLLIAVTINQNGVTDLACAGFTKLVPDHQDTSGAYEALLAKIADGSEQAGRTITWTGSGHWVVNYYEYSGELADLGSITESVTNPWAEGATTTPAAAAPSPTTDSNELAVFIAGRVSRNTMQSGPTGGFVLDDDVVSSGGTATTGTGMSVAHKILTANETPSSSVTLGNSRRWGAAVFVFKAASVTTTQKSSSDSGTGADASSLAVRDSSSDSGGGSDSTTVHASISNTESGSGFDAQSQLASIFSSEFAHGTDNFSVAVGLIGMDVASGTDALAALMTAIASSDAAGGADAGGLAGAAQQFTDNDFGIGSDDQMIAVKLTVNDVALGTDGASLVVKIPVADSAEAVEAVLLVVAASDADVGSIADAGALRALLPSDDLGVGSDTTLALLAALTAAESATGSDLIGSLRAQVGSLDLGEGSDLGEAIFGIFIRSGATGMLLGASRRVPIVQVSSDKPVIGGSEAGEVPAAANDPGRLTSGGSA